jgi:hypothetical protein
VSEEDPCTANGVEMYGLASLGGTLLLGTILSVGADQTTSAQVFDYLGPILSTGMVGVILLMILFRIRIMPTYVHDDAKVEWLRERSDLQADIADLKATLKDANTVYTQQVIPVLTRVFEAEKELVEIRRNEQYNKAVKPNDQNPFSELERARKEAYERGRAEGSKS